MVVAKWNDDAMTTRINLERRAPPARWPLVKVTTEPHGLKSHRVSGDHPGGPKTGDTNLVSPGKWYDPISERWIAPREMRLKATSPEPCANHVLELQRTLEIKRIWRALVDCCARD
jgi:hypothetical protein